MYLLESGEFLNVGLFCRVSCYRERNTQLIFSQRLFHCFFSLIYLCIYL